MLLSDQYRRTWRMLERARNLDRRGVPREQRMAEHMREVDRRAASLPPRPVSESAADEIHMLCGRKHLGMGCLALWSFLRWIPFDVAVYVHSDGTTTPDDVQTWRSRFPNLNVVLPEEMKPLRDELLERGPYPYLRKFADVNLYPPKLIDFHLAGRGDRIVMLDSDVLYFQWPDELLRAWEAARPGRERIFTTFNDIFDAYFVPLNEVEQVVGRRPLERFNAGMTIAPKFPTQISGTWNPSWRESSNPRRSTSTAATPSRPSTPSSPPRARPTAWATTTSSAGWRRRRRRSTSPATSGSCTTPRASPGC